MEITKYPKINSIFKRDDDGNFTDEFSRPEFEYLYRNMWTGTEKIDGTNIRIGWDGYNVEFRGRTDKAQLQPILVACLESVFTQDAFENAFGTHDEEGTELPNIVLYGEGYGAGIQKGGGLYRPDQGFILFDVKIGDLWLERHNVEDIARKLYIPSVPVVFHNTLERAVDFARKGFRSRISLQEKQAEGLVLFPDSMLLDRRGYRIMTKVKEKDFQ